MSALLRGWLFRLAGVLVRALLTHRGPRRRSYPRPHLLPEPPREWVSPSGRARIAARSRAQAAPATQGHEPLRVRVCPQHPPTEHPLAGQPARIRLDLDRPYETAQDGLLVQRAVIDVLLTDGRMSRLGVLALYDPTTHEPRHISYIPIHELTESEVVG
jgi:hypothetical protein